MTDRDADWRLRDRARWMKTDAARWMRPDAARWIRPDIARYLKPGTDPADVFPALDQKYNPNQRRIPAGRSGGGRWTNGERLSSGFGTSVDNDEEDTSDSDIDVDALEDVSDDEFDIDAVELDSEEPGSSDATDFSAQSRRGRGPSESDFPGASTQQLSRLDQAMARSANGIARVREYDTTWSPREQNLSAPGSIEGAIATAEARARQAEARLDQVRSGIGGNFSPPLDPLSRGPASSQRTFDGAGWIDAYRTINNSPNLFGEPAWPRDNGTVAVSEVSGRLYVGVNSGTPSYTGLDRSRAFEARDSVAELVPNITDPGNRGSTPNNAFFHAEATLLLRAASDHSGSLQDKLIDITVDRPVCGNCSDLLPRLGLVLGNPVVSFTERNSGLRSIMVDGQWQVWRKR